MAKNLKKHIRTIHLDHKDYKCEICGKSFSLTGDVRKHIHAMHEEHEDEYRCESCGKSLTTL